MRIAIFLQNENFIDENMVQAYAFTIHDNVIVSMGEELLSVRNIKYLLSWLLARNINIAYINYQKREEIEKHFKKIGVKLKSLDEIRTNPLLKNFLVTEKG